MPSILNNRFIALLKLVRFENLLIIAFTQYLLRYFVVQKILKLNGIYPELDNSLFFLVVFSTVLIAAAGYIINDYFDVKTDLINHPDTVVVDKIIKRRWAIILHITFTMLGVLIGMYAALKTGYLRLALFHLTAAILLWFYSTDLKKKLLVGNIIVSLLSASVAFMPFIYEMAVIQKFNPEFIHTSQAVIISALKITLIFCLFAFITSLTREIIKDLEDYKGDKATGGLTMPIVWGMRSSKLIAFFLSLITAILLLFVVYNAIRSQRVIFNLNNSYILFLLIGPLLLLAAFILKAQNSKQYKQASFVLKIIMLLGLSYSFVFYYT